ncbi:MAG: hypothetical protein J6V08_05445 [Candidatus Methanomethylophilaceae archaeon]|nr:hypothetical protein [Candidatus Methanomethylophilaceae archaeon]
MIIALVIAFVIAIGVVVVIVEFQDPKVTVTVSQEGEGTVDPSVGTHDFDENSTITVKATPANGYLLYGITVNGESVAVNNNQAEVKVSADTDIVVTFENYASVSAQDPVAGMSVPGPYGRDATVTVNFKGLVSADNLMVTNYASQNYGTKASVLDMRLSNRTNFESASITMSMTGDLSKGTVVSLSGGQQPTGISMTYDSASNMSVVSFTTTHFSQFLIYDGHVSTAQGLRNIAQMVNTGMADIPYVILDKDIDLNNQEWTPIGKDSVDSVNKPYAFDGTFDGKGFRIMNLNISTGNDQVGLFGVVVNARISDFTLMNVSVIGGSKVGSVVGESMFDTQVSDVDVRSCTVIGNHFVGGVVGYMQGTVTECTVTGTSDAHSMIKAIPNMTGTVYDNGDKVGGIVGYVQNHQMDMAYSVSACEVGYTDLVAYRDVGGLIGCIVETDPNYAVMINGNIVYDVNVTADQTVNQYGYVTPNANKIVGRLSGEYTARNNSFSQTVTMVRVEVDSNSDLEEIMNNGSDKVYVRMVSDLALDVSEPNVQYGGRNTAQIQIDGNNNTLTLSTTQISSMDLVNPGGMLMLTNLGMTSTQTSGTWDVYDILFKCNVTMESVTFDKAIALDNVGRTSVLKNVKITENNDYYAMWIVAGADVSIDGLVIDSEGRGIKVSDQYVTNPGLTEISITNSTFDTAKKAAILVGSAGGAYVDWGTGNDISKVSADKNNAVWVDIDYVPFAGKVTVKGCTKVVEPMNA